jgi:hypothetical protein
MVLDRRVVQAQNAAALEKQNQLLEAHIVSLGGHFALNLAQSEREVAAIGRKWEKKPALQVFQGEVALAEPQRPHWLIFGKHRLRASGQGDEPLLEAALEEHFQSENRWRSFQWKGRNFVFLRGVIDGVPYASAYQAEDLFSRLGAGVGLTSWVLDSEGNILFHPLSRFIGSQVANVRPVTAGIAQLRDGRADGVKAFSQRFKNLEGKETLGAFLALPSSGLLLGTEWMGVRTQGAMGSWLWWLALAFGAFAVMILSRSLFMSKGEGPKQEPFSEDRLPPEALDYLAEVRKGADANAAEIQRLESELSEIQSRLLEEREKAGIEEWKGLQWRAFFRDVLPQVSRGKEVWHHFLRMAARGQAGTDYLLYRYSPTTFSLVPEAAELSGPWDSKGRAQLLDGRIYVGNERYLESLVHTESYRRWRISLAKAAGERVEGLEAKTLILRGPGKHLGLLLVMFPAGSQRERELEGRLEQLKEMSESLREFCVGVEGLLHFSNDEGVHKTLAGTPNNAGDKPRQPSSQLSDSRPPDWRRSQDSRAP